MSGCACEVAEVLAKGHKTGAGRIWERLDPSREVRIVDIEVRLRVDCV